MLIRLLPLPPCAEKRAIEFLSSNDKQACLCEYSRMLIFQNRLSVTRSLCLPSRFFLVSCLKMESGISKNENCT